MSAPTAPPVMRTNKSGRTRHASRIAAGQPAKGFQVDDIRGQPVRLADYAGRHVLLSFFRFASCPYCNLRVHRMIARYAAYHAQGLDMIAVFESPRDTLHRYV